MAIKKTHSKVSQNSDTKKVKVEKNSTKSPNSKQALRKKRNEFGDNDAIG